MTQHTVNWELEQQAISHQVYLMRLSGGTSNKIIALLNRVDDDLINQIKLRAPESGVWTTKRLNALLSEIRGINNQIYNTTNEFLADDMTELANYEVDFQARRLTDTLPIDLNIVRPSNALIRSAVHSRPFKGRLLKEWGKDLETAAFKRVRDSIRIGVVEGEPIDAIVRRIRGTRALNYKDGVLEISRRQARALVRTAVSHTTASAKSTLYKQNSEIIKGVKLVATLDLRTSSICRTRSGNVYDLGKEPPLPFHIGERSTYSAVTKSWRELGIDLDEAPEGTRSSMDGQVPASTTYNQWLKTRSVPEQNDILGVKKGKLFRDGGLSVDRFTDRAGNELNLKELKAKEAPAFKRAGVEI